tara:strand:+ start:60 stop:1853 length:1794 start_codon:yes stop_codon:yes gene_type:complete
MLFIILATLTPIFAQECNENTCPNTREFNLQCASNGKTYNNPGMIKCYNLCPLPNITILHSGKCTCNDYPAVRDCMTTADYAPVCGFDGTTYTTYSNTGSLSCANNCPESNISLVHQGECNSSQGKATKRAPPTVVMALLTTIIAASLLPPISSTSTQKSSSFVNVCLLLLFLFISTTQATKIPRTYCNEAMETGIIPPLPSSASLLQIHILHRHGARTKSSYNTVPHWKNEDNVLYNCSADLLEGSSADINPDGSTVLYRKLYVKNRNLLKGSNCMLGQLVQDGLKQCTSSGINLMKRYSSFLPTAPNEQDFYLRSDDCPRTLASGQALFSAMYPKSNVIIPWNTMDINGNAETIAPNINVCPSLKQAEINLIAKYKLTNHYINDVVPLANKISIALNRTIAPDSVGGLLDPLMSVQCSTVPSTGGDPPLAFTAELQQLAINEQVSQLYYGCNDTKVAKFGAGPLLGEILVFMEKAIEMDKGVESVVPKFIQWSGHDTGPMAPVLGALRIGGAEFPVFNDLLAMELYKMNGSDDEFAVRVVHNGDVVTTFIPGCPTKEELCPWKIFHNTVAKIVPTAIECGRSDDPEWWPSPMVLD